MWPQFSSKAPTKEDFDFAFQLGAMPRETFVHMANQFPGHKIPKLKNFTAAKKDWKNSKALLNELESIYDNPFPLFPHDIGRCDIGPKAQNQARQACDNLFMSPYMSQATNIKELKESYEKEFKNDLCATQFAAVDDLYVIGLDDPRHFKLPEVEQKFTQNDLEMLYKDDLRYKKYYEDRGAEDPCFSVQPNPTFDDSLMPNE